MHETASTDPTRKRRWMKRPANPNDDAPNAALSVRDVQLLVRELENYLNRIRGATGVATHRRHALKLIDKLHQVRWST